MARDSYMRDKLKEVYPNDAWRAKVNKMSREQILAIYRRLVAQKVIKE